MKTTILTLIVATLFIVSLFETHAQGFIYDQQSATNPTPVQGNGNVDGLDIQEDSPLLQSFIPSLSAIGFVQFEFWDIPNNGTNGATVYVNLWTGSTLTNTATFLGSTAPTYMPNGFVNNGLSIAGITNFYFITPIILTSGQTYYLQPVVKSGDDPWDIITIGNTYSSGQLYGKTGGYFQPSTDFWFREGVVAVPEPSILALMGSSSLLALKIRRRLRLLIFMLFCAVTFQIYAQSDSVVQATAENAGLASATTLPRISTYWIISVNFDGTLTKMPYPMLPPEMSGLPIYYVTNGIYIVDDTDGHISNARMNRAQAAAIAQRQANDVGNLVTFIQTSDDESFHADDFAPMFIDTNGLWLDTSNENDSIVLRLYNSLGGYGYQILSTSNLLNPNWNLGEIMYGGASEVDFSPISMTNAMMFYRVHQAIPVIQLNNYGSATEPNPTNSDPGQIGFFFLENENYQTNDVTVYYSLGGTAQNGIDYSNLTGSVILPVDSGYTYVHIDPIADGLKPDQTIIFTISQNTNYLIDPNNYSATNILLSNPDVYPVANGDRQSLFPETQFNYTLQAQDPRDLTLTYNILTYPTHGIFTTNGSLPYVTYTATNCYEGQDSFTFTVNDGEFTSLPATVNLLIGDSVSADAISAQTCRGTPVGFALSAGDGSGLPLHYFISPPDYGTVSNMSGADTNINYIYTPAGTNFTGLDTFTYIAYTECGDMATNIVTITNGDAQLYPQSQNVMTGIHQPVSLTLSGVDYDSCKADTNYYIYSINGSLTNGYLSGTLPNLTYTPTNGDGVDSFQVMVNDGVFTSSVPATITLFTTSGPTNLTTQCVTNGAGILLKWNLDSGVQTLETMGLSIQNFQIYRSTNSTFTTNNIIYLADSSQTNYVDLSVIPGASYYYTVTFSYQDPYTGKVYFSPASSPALITVCEPPSLGTNGVDVVFIIDNTISMWGSGGEYDLSRHLNGIYNALNYFIVASQTNCRVALVTPDSDQVDVRIGLTNNIGLFESTLPYLPQGGVGGPPESTDECLNTIAHALTASGRTNIDGCTHPDALQINDFTPNFRTNALKFVILITDAPPGGFCDNNNIATMEMRAHQYAQAAATNHIQINAIQVWHPNQQPYDAQTVMQDYASTSCGWYSQLSGSPSDDDIANAVLNVIYQPDACQ